jgi:hydrogenase maturation protease
VTERAPFVVLGLGNELFTDEGLGPAAARRLTERNIAGVDVLDGGTLGLSLLPELEGRAGALFLDAMAAEGAQPGDILELDAADLDRPFQMCCSAHQLGLTETLQAARLVGNAPTRVAAVGMIPFSLETGYGLSPQASARLDAVVETAESILRDWLAEMAHA